MSSSIESDPISRAINFIKENIRDRDSIIFELSSIISQEKEKPNKNQYVIDTLEKWLDVIDHIPKPTAAAILSMIEEYSTSYRIPLSLVNFNPPEGGAAVLPKPIAVKKTYFPRPVRVKPPQQLKRIQSLVKPNLYQRYCNIISWNMYSGKCIYARTSNSILPFFDLLATQENNSHIITVPNQVCGNGTEKIGMYSRTPLDVQCLSSDQEKHNFLKEQNIPVSIRYAAITTIKGITVANIHLEGGRFCDPYVLHDDEVIRKKLVSYKIDMIEQVLAYQPDLIVGDFNSTLPYFYPNQFNYFSKLVKRELTDKDKQCIIEWNEAPLSLLVTHGYHYVQPKKEEITSHIGRSIVDMMWYKNVKVHDSYILPFPYESQEDCISDHNPVIGTFYKESEIIVPIQEYHKDMKNTKQQTTCNVIDIPISDDIRERILSTKMQAFHVTTQETAIKIINSGMFRCGSSGTFGPGIYFCPRPLDTIYKAGYRDQDVHFTILFEVDVYLGTSFITDKFTGIQPDLSLYDSVIFMRDTGIEYVVFRPYQVQIKAMYRLYSQFIKEYVIGLDETRETSFDTINRQYVLGGWTFTGQQTIQSTRYMYELGPYDRITIPDRIEECITYNKKSDSTFTIQPYSGKRNSKIKKVKKRTSLICKKTNGFSKNH